MRRILLLAAIAFALASCDNKNAAAPTQPIVTTFDFSLEDVHPTSPSYTRMVSPAQSLGHPVVLFIGAAT